MGIGYRGIKLIIIKNKRGRKPPQKTKELEMSVIEDGKNNFEETIKSCIKMQLIWDVPMAGMSYSESGFSENWRLGLEGNPFADGSVREAYFPILEQIKALRDASGGDHWAESLTADEINCYEIYQELTLANTILIRRAIELLDFQNNDSDSDKCVYMNSVFEPLPPTLKIYKNRIFGASKFSACLDMSNSSLEYFLDVWK